MAQKGILFILSGPSGSGKTTLCRLIEKRLGLYYSISYTTRPPRPGEENGRDYFFVTPEAFEQMLQRGELLESAIVHDHWYGTHRSPIEDAQERGQDVILDLDPQGALAIQSKKPESVLIFIDTPHSHTLRERLEKRGTETQEKIETRLKNAEQERKLKGHYSYSLVNEDLEETYREIVSILEKKRSEKI